LIAAAKSVEEGCRAAGITAQTWYNWLKDAPFKAEVDRQREAVTTEALDRLKGSVRVAVECLRSLLDVDEKSIRLKACGEVLDYFMKAREIEGIERRLDEIERIMRQEEARERQR
jgi:Mg2+ and Co2+ transporter CorA